MILELIRIALASLAGSKLRSSLSALGLIIGIASVVSIYNFGSSATASVQSDISAQGLGILTIVPGRNADQETQRIFVRELSDEILDEVDGLRQVSPINSERLAVRWGDESYSSEVLAVDESFFGLFNLSIASGAFLSGSDGDGAASVAVIGDELATSLFGGEDPVGKRVRVSGQNESRSLKIVGRLATRDSSQGIDFDASLFIPFETFKARFRRTDRVQRYLAVVEDGRDSLEVSESIKRFLNVRTGNPDSFRVMSPASIAAMLTGVTNTLNVFLTGAAAISLLVGGVGIMNIMLVSVTERTREIGIRKALGASPVHILAQFVAESIVLTLGGGILGALLGIGLSYATTTALGWSFSLNPSSVVTAIGFSSLVGLVFGWYPASRAARMDPIVALSYE